MSMSREAAEIIRRRKIAIVTIRRRALHRQAASCSDRKTAAARVHNVDRVAMANRRPKSRGVIRPAWTTSWQVAHFGKIIQVRQQQQFDENEIPSTALNSQKSRVNCCVKLNQQLNFPPSTT
jgi:hypothetical protein